MGVKKRREPKGKSNKKKKRSGKVQDSEDPAFAKARLRHIAKTQAKQKKRIKLLVEPPTKSNLLMLIRSYLRDSGFPAAAKKMKVELADREDESDLGLTIKKPEPYTLGYIFLKWHRREKKLEGRLQPTPNGEILSPANAEKQPTREALPASDSKAKKIKKILASSGLSSKSSSKSSSDSSSSDSEDVPQSLEPPIIKSGSKRKASDDLVSNSPEGKKKPKVHSDAGIEGIPVSNGKAKIRKASDGDAFNGKALSEAVSLPLPKSTSTSEDSESDFAKKRRVKKEKKEKMKIGKTKQESSKSAKAPVIEANGALSSINPEPTANGSATPLNDGDLLSSAAVTSDSMNSDRLDMINKIAKKRNTPFSRIPANTKVDPRLASNEYVPYDYAEQAHRDLIVTKGKGFTKEKNKKKRGSYRGGPIDVHSKKGIRFD
ncbi:MAG: hypothetical protein M1829_003311 [Trizodia sp. TS-e1964]|nr:MAG: hypothetical protein M1829_003311 [Trizodia sp. TS-e1964]